MDPLDKINNKMAIPEVKNPPQEANHETQNLVKAAAGAGVVPKDETKTSPTRAISSHIQPVFQTNGLTKDLIVKLVSRVKEQSGVLSAFLTSMASIQAAAQGIKSRFAVTGNEEITNKDGVTQFSRLNKIDREFTKFIEFFEKNLIHKLSKAFFPLYFKNVLNITLQKKHETFKTDLTDLKQEKDMVQGRIKLLKIRIKNEEGLIQNKVLEFELMKQEGRKSILDEKIHFIEVRLQSTDEIKNALKAVRKERQKLSSSNPDDVPRIALNREKKAELIALQKARGALPESVRAKIDLDRARLAKFESLNEKGQLTRERLVKIGGERLSLETKDGAKLDGVFMDASKFREKLVASGGEFVTFSRNDGPPLKGIAFDKAGWTGNEDHIIKTLKDLNAISYDNELIAGWTPVAYTPPDNRPGNAKIILFPTSSLPQKDRDKNWIQKSSRGKLPKFIINTGLDPKFEKIDTKSQGGTVILSTGNQGVYEQDKDQAAAFLFQGMNVVLFNYRGVGLSEGVPSDQNYHEDIETVYQFTKKRTGQEDKEILFKGLCFGGGPSAYAAAEHPETNLFLDQTYSSFKRVVKENAQEMIEKKIDDLHAHFDPEEVSVFATRAKGWLKENIVPIVASCASLFAPNFEVSRNLAKNEGKKAIFYVHDDDTISFAHVEKNIRAAYEGGKSVQLIASTGEHADDWMNLRARREQYRDLDAAEKKIWKKYEELHAPLKTIESKNKIFIQTYKKLIKKEKENLNWKAKLDEVKKDRADIKAKKRELEALEEKEVNQLYEQYDLNETNLEITRSTPRYSARNGMLDFLADAHLSAPIL